jgi:hypothetical protein
MTCCERALRLASCSGAFDQFQRWSQSPRGRRLFRPAQFTFQQAPVVIPQGARLGFRFRQSIGERVLVGGFQMQRLFFDDLDLAFGRQAQDREVFAHDVVPIRIHSAPSNIASLSIYCDATYRRATVKCQSVEAFFSVNQNVHPAGEI